MRREDTHTHETRSRILALEGEKRAIRAEIAEAHRAFASLKGSPRYAVDEDGRVHALADRMREKTLALNDRVAAINREIDHLHGIAKGRAEALEEARERSRAARRAGRVSGAASGGGGGRG